MSSESRQAAEAHQHDAPACPDDPGPLRSPAGERAAHPLPPGPVIVTVDGPAGTGKSSVSREAAAELGLEFLDTGAMYRGAAALAIKNGLDPLDEDAIVRLTLEADLHFDWSHDPPTLLAYDKPFTALLRTPEVDAKVSGVAAMPKLREVMVRLQRKIAAQHPRLLTEGRDQGSVVFPAASAKIYLDASVRARAARRARQLRSLGLEVNDAAIERDLERRDKADRERPVGPLVCPDDAIVVDTSDLSFEEAVRTVVDTVRRAVASGAGRAAEGGA